MSKFEEYRSFRALKTLLILSLLAFVYVPICFVAKLSHYMRCKSKEVKKNGITVVVTGAKMYKSTMIVKWLGRAGYDVVLVETEKFWCSGSRFSKHVSKFYTVPDAKRHPEKYVQELYKICMDHKAKVFLPACAPATEELDSIVGSKLRSHGVKVLHTPYDLMESLNHKHQFCELMKEKRLAVPESYLVKSNEDVYELNEMLRQKKEQASEGERHKFDFILKNIEYDPVHRLDCFRLPTTRQDLSTYLKRIAADGNAIVEKRPWTVQRFIDGVMWASMHVQLDGQTCLYTCTRSQASCFNWEHEENEQIKDWCRRFAMEFSFDGIFTNDFIVDKHDGVAYAIECNPRLGSQVSLFHSVDDMAGAFLGRRSPNVIEPPIGTKTYTTLNELFQLLDPVYYADEEPEVDSYLERVSRFIRTIQTGSDPIFDEDDLLPFFMINFF